MLFNKRIDIGTVICPKAVALARGRRLIRLHVDKKQSQYQIYYLMTIFLNNFYLFKKISLKENFIWICCVNIFQLN